MKYATETKDIGAGKVAVVMGGEDITVFLNAEEGEWQTIQVAIDRDEGGLGPIRRWYDYEFANAAYNKVFLLKGTFRYVRVLGAQSQELPFSISWRYVK